MSKFTSSVPPASSLEEARDLAFGEHRGRIGSVDLPYGYSSHWRSKPLVTYIFRRGEKFALSKMAMADLQFGNLMDPEGGPMSGEDVTLAGRELEALAAIVLTLPGNSWPDAEFGYRVIFQMWAEDYDVPVYVRIGKPSHHWFNTIWEHTTTDCRVISPKGERPCEAPENHHEL